MRDIFLDIEQVFVYNKTIHEHLFFLMEMII